MGVIGVRLLVRDSKSHPKVSAFKLRIGGDLGGGARKRKQTLLENIGAVRDLEAILQAERFRIHRYPDDSIRRVESS